MDVETSIPVPSRVEEGEQSLMDESHADESHADDSDLVQSDPEAVMGVDIMDVEAPEELIVLSCDAFSQTFIGKRFQIFELYFLVRVRRNALFIVFRIHIALIRVVH